MEFTSPSIGVRRPYSCCFVGLSLRVLRGTRPSEVEGYILSPSTEFILSVVEGLGMNSAEGWLCVSTPVEKKSIFTG